MTDLSGLWDGTYAYPTALEPVPFRAELRDHDGRLSGEVREPAPPYMAAGDLAAMITGARSASHSWQAARLLALTTRRWRSGSA